MTTLFDLTYRVAVLLGGVLTGTATGGAVGSLIDTAGLAGLDNDLYNGGTCWIVKSTDGLAPQGEYAIIADFVALTKTATFRANVTAAVQAGDTYALSKKRYPLHRIIQKVNEVMATAGKVPVEDSSTTTVANQRIYNLPAAASMDLRQVWLETDPDNDFWLPIYDWDVIYSAGGTVEQVMVNHDFIDGDTLKFIYITPHAALWTYSAVLNEVIHPDRIVFKAAADLMTEFMDRTKQYQYRETRDRLLVSHERAILSTPAPKLPKKAWYKNIWNTGEYWLAEVT
jgi:hypothetical protein